MNFNKRDEFNKNFSKVIKSKFNDIAITENLIMEISELNNECKCRYIGGYRKCKKCPFHVELQKKKWIFTTYSTCYCLGETSLKGFSYMCRRRGINKIKFTCKDKNVKNKNFIPIRNFFVYFLTNKKMQDMTEFLEIHYDFLTDYNLDFIIDGYFVSRSFFLALKNIKRGKY